MKYVSYLFVFAVFLGCQNVEKPAPPDDLIPQDKMVDVLTEAYLSNAARSFNTRVVRDQGYKIDSILYAKHGIDSLQYATSNAYYSANLDTYYELFSEVNQRLEQLKEEKDSLKKIYEERIRVRDSIKRDSIAKGLIEIEVDEENEIDEPTSLDTESLLKKDENVIENNQLGTPLKTNADDDN